MEKEVVVYVADAGSVARHNFHWVSSRNTATSSGDPKALVEAIVDDLKNKRRASLGYESPLFVPAPENSSSLGCARDGECQEATGNRPFTAGAGAAVLATGIQSLAWVLREIKKCLPDATASTRWTDFVNGSCPLFIWEAFVSGSEKAYPPSHAGDAALAIAAFNQVMKGTKNPTRINCGSALSLAGAAILWAGLASDASILHEPCVVLRPLFSIDEAKGRLTGYKLRQAEAKAKKKGRKS